MARGQVTVDGDGNFPSDAGLEFKNGDYTFALENPSGATAKLQVSPDGGTTWLDLPDGSFTAATVKNLKANGTGLIRVNVASHSSDFDFWL